MSLELRRRLMVQAEPKDIIIDARKGGVSGDAANDAALMEVIYAQGWSKSPKYMTKREAEAVTIIGSAFSNNTEITNLNVLEYFINATGSISFDGCTSLSAVTIPENTTSLSNYGLRNTLVEYLYIPKKTSINPASAFSGASHLAYIEVDGNHPTYHSYKGLLYTTSSQTCNVCPAAFKGDIEIKEGTKIINRIISLNRTGITSIYVPDGVETIAASAFNFSNWGMNEPQGTLRIPSSVTSLGKYFARGSGFTKVEYYSSVTIPTSAFLSCGLLKTFVIYNTEKVVDLELVPYGNNGNINYTTNHPFREVKLDAIYVPDGLYEDYINSEAWKTGFNLTLIMKKLSEYTE